MVEKGKGELIYGSKESLVKGLVCLFLKGLVLHTGIVSICSKRNYANYGQNIYALTEMYDFLLRLNYLTVLIFTLSVYFCN